MDLEDLRRPRDLGSLCLVNRQLKVEATEAFFTVSSFEVTILTAMQDIYLFYYGVNWGQHVSLGPFLWTFQEYRRRVARAQPLLPSRASLSWGIASFFRLSVSTSSTRSRT